MLPFSKHLRKVNQRSQTPIVALLVFGVIDLGVMWYGYLQASAFATLVGATAIIPYIIYFLITVAYAVKRRTTDSIPGAFTLGRWAWPVIVFVLVYTLVIMASLAFPAPFHGADKVIGYALALAALWYFGALLAAAERHRGRQANQRPGRQTLTTEFDTRPRLPGGEALKPPGMALANASRRGPHGRTHTDGTHRSRT